MGVSGASSPPSVDVDFTPLSPPKKVLSNTSIGANVTKLVVVSGGTATGVITTDIGQKNQVGTTSR